MPDSRRLAASSGEIQKQYDENRQGDLEIIRRRNQLDQELDNLHRQQYNVKKQVAAYRILIAESQTGLGKAQNRHNSPNAVYKGCIRTTEENGSLFRWEALLPAES